MFTNRERDLKENLDFLHCEIGRTREESCPVQACVFRATRDKTGRKTPRVCVTATENPNVDKVGPP
jgi:hypothetical protein